MNFSPSVETILFILSVIIIVVGYIMAEASRDSSDERDVRIKQKVLRMNLAMESTHRSLSRLEGNKFLASAKDSQNQVCALELENQSLNEKLQKMEQEMKNAQQEIERLRQLNLRQASNNDDAPLLVVKEEQEEDDCDSGHLSEEDGHPMLVPNFAPIVEKEEVCPMMDVDMLEVLIKCQSAEWQQRQAGLEQLVTYLEQTRSPRMVQEIGNMFFHIIVDNDTEKPSLLLKAFDLFLETHGNQLEDLAKMLLYRVLGKLSISNLVLSCQGKIALGSLAKRMSVSVQVPIFSQFLNESWCGLSKDSLTNVVPILRAVDIVIYQLYNLLMTHGGNCLDSLEYSELETLVQTIIDLGTDGKLPHHDGDVGTTAKKFLLILFIKGNHRTKNIINVARLTNPNTLSWVSYCLSDYKQQ